MLHKRTRSAAAVPNSFAFVLAADAPQSNSIRSTPIARPDHELTPAIVGQAGAPDRANSRAAANEVTAVPEAVLSEVAVTATRSEKALEKIPGAVSVITQKDLATFVPDCSPSRQKMTSFGESLRGRQALILFDSIPQSNPLRDGTREGYFADADVIERIEVVNGPSAIQGKGATLAAYGNRSVACGTPEFGQTVKNAGAFRPAIRQAVIGNFARADPGGTQHDYLAGRGRTYALSDARRF